MEHFVPFLSLVRGALINSVNFQVNICLISQRQWQRGVSDYGLALHGDSVLKHCSLSDASKSCAYVCGGFGVASAPFMATKMAYHCVWTQTLSTFSSQECFNLVPKMWRLGSVVLPWDWSWDCLGDQNPQVLETQR